MKNKEVWFLASVSPLSDDAVLWVARDITKLKKFQAELKQAKETADAANLAKSQFLSNMSHELRTPLNIILGFTQLMLRGKSLEPQQQDYLDTINRSGEDLLTLINDVLEMSKIEAGRVMLNETNFDLYHLLDRLRHMFDLKAQSKGLHLIFERSPAVPQYICTDESKLRQVLVNLIGNAIKFTQQGGVMLRVSLEHGEREDTEMKAEGNPQSSVLSPQSSESTQNSKLNTQNSPLPQTPHPTPHTLLFEVEDTGCGIAPADRERLFEPFVQTEAGQRSQEGTGLGLPISQRFVHLMGGNLTVDSMVGKGSTFSFQIQARVAVQDDVPAPTSSLEVIGLEAGQPTYRILIAEDKPENRRLLVELLSPIGFEVREAENGQRAIELCQTWSPHLIWMDIRMPVLSGFEATQQIKALEGQPPVIIALTGSAFEEDRMMALSIGCDDFVRKPFRTAVIFEKMAEHLGVRYRYMDALETQEMKEVAADTVASIPIKNLQEMPSAWVEQLYEAALRVNAKQILMLIEQIPKSENDLIWSLIELVDRYSFNEIVAATEQVMQQEVTLSGNRQGYNG
ncbi:response regulator [Kovacikia minuta CCNUW1]|uniref:ATP-binding protein n=1 Tax=Kovacikia minuta TaxID=2931930 RepID=UPI001CC9FBFB|nr:ATP-binding protein [Kovacikia minuta]UBF27091.1 response regulator [Kovacikia minuta CCNUW1]